MARLRPCVGCLRPASPTASAADPPCWCACFPPAHGERERERQRNIYMYMYIYAYVYIYIYTYVHIYIYIYNKCMHTHTIIHTCMHACIHTYIHIYIYLMAAATAADPKESHHGFVEGTGRYGRAASSRSAGLEPRC